MSKDNEKINEKMKFWRQQERSEPENIHEAGSEEESVWDYPDHPKILKASKKIKVVFNEEIIGKTKNGLKIIEKSIPPTFYFPPEDVKTNLLRKATETETLCEWKGLASYYDVVVDKRMTKKAAWKYPNPTEYFKQIENYYSFYPQKVDNCWVGEKMVSPQKSNYYGGWVTSNIKGPFKNQPRERG